MLMSPRFVLPSKARDLLLTVVLSRRALRTTALMPA